MQRGDPDQLLRTNQRTNERYVAILCRVEDAALKFRGCFQAICELRSENQQGEDRPEGGVPADRAWSSLNLSIHPSSAHLSHPPLIRVRLSPSHSFPSFRLFQLPLTFSPTFTASSRFAPWLGHPLFAPHTEAQRNEQSPLHVLLVHLGSPNPSQGQDHRQEKSTSFSFLETLRRKKRTWKLLTINSRIEIIFLQILVHQNPYFQKFPSDNYLTRDTKRKKKIPV